MTIKYLDSKRISALAADTKPTNVETNSILVEKDTGVRRWFDGTAWSGIWNYNHDFSTDDGLWSFANPSATNKVDTGAGVLRTDTTSSNTGGINKACSGDIFGGIVSDTAWVLQIDLLTYTSLTSAGQNGFGMSAVDYSVPSYNTSGWNNGSGDLLYFYTYQQGSTDCYTRLGYTAGGGNGSGDDVLSTDTLVPNMYYQLIRTSATSSTGQWGTNSDFTSPTVNLTNTVIPSTIDNLRYVKFGNLVYTGFGGAMVGNFSALRFADGVTVAP